MKGYEEYEDLPGEATIQVYSLEEIISEKVVALADQARNEPRDLYDVWYLTELEKMDLASLIPEITAKLEFRGRGLEGMGEEFAKKRSTVEKTMADEAGKSDGGATSLRGSVSRRTTDLPGRRPDGGIITNR